MKKQEIDFFSNMAEEITNNGSALAVTTSSFFTPTTTVFSVPSIRTAAKSRLTKTKIPSLSQSLIPTIAGPSSVASTVSSKTLPEYTGLLTAVTVSSTIIPSSSATTVAPPQTTATLTSLEPLPKMTPLPLPLTTQPTTTVQSDCESITQTAPSQSLQSTGVIKPATVMVPNAFVELLEKLMEAWQEVRNHDGNLYRENGRGGRGRQRRRRSWRNRGWRSHGWYWCNNGWCWHRYGGRRGWEPKVMTHMYFP